MEKIFYADKTAYSTEEALKKILSEFYGVKNPIVLRTEHGKPYVQNAPQFSITHTSQRLYIVFSQETIGIDAELLSRKLEHKAIVKKFPYDERNEIVTTRDFLTHWVVKESAVKYSGSTLAKDLKKLTFTNGALLMDGEPFPAVITLLEHSGHILSVCAKRDFTNVEFKKI